MQADAEDLETQSSAYRRNLLGTFHKISQEFIILTLRRCLFVQKLPKTYAMVAQSEPKTVSGRSCDGQFTDQGTFCPATASDPQSFSGEKNQPQSSRNNKEPTMDEMQNLRHVSDSIPPGVWLMALISLCERFTYYGISAPFQNYIQNPLHDPLRPGALNLGQSAATKLNYFFSVFVYVTPIGAAIIADSWLGKYKTLVGSTAIYLTGCVILVATSVPSALRAHAGLSGLIISMIVIGIGLGGIKACVSPFMADQYTNVKMRVETTKTGEKVIVDRDLTIRGIYSLYYWCINLGCLSGLATTFIEKEVGFWAAYLLPFCVLWIALAGLILGRRKFVDRPPEGSILPSTFRAFMYAMREHFNMDAAKPEHQQRKHGKAVNWDDGFISELRQGLMACRVFAAYPILWLCHSQITTNLISQAGQMETHGIPNDIMTNLNPISVIVFLPIVEQLLYPTLRKWNLRFGTISRIAVGFVLEAGALAYTAVVQHMIYSASPCYDNPLKCATSLNGTEPNHINVFLQTPVYVIDGIAEIFFDVTSQEYAYTKAPTSMKSLIQAVLVLTSALGLVFGFALSPLYTDPQILFLYAALAAAMFVTAGGFFWCFKSYDRGEGEANGAGEKVSMPLVKEVADLERLNIPEERIAD